MTPRSCVGYHSTIAQGFLTAVSSLTFFAGIWLVTTGVLAFSSFAALLPARNLLWLVDAGPGGGQWNVILAPLSVLTGLWFAAAAISIWRGATAPRIRQVVSTIAFLPGLWAVLSLVTWIPNDQFLWRLSAIPVAFLFRAGAYHIADVISLRIRERQSTRLAAA
jgi:hypothetical protein